MCGIIKIKKLKKFNHFIFSFTIKTEASENAC